MPIYPSQSATEPAIDLPSTLWIWAFLNLIWIKTLLGESTTESDFIAHLCAKLPKNSPIVATTRRNPATTSM